MVSLLPVKQIVAKPKQRRRRSRIAPFILGSVLFHLLLLLLLVIYQFDFIDKQAKKEKQPEFIEITELPVPKEKETKPPEKTKRLAERSRTVPEEKTRDKFTKRSVTTPPVPETIPQPKPKPKPEVKKQEPKKPEKQVVKKTETKTAKKTAKNTTDTEIRKRDLMRKEVLASLPKEQLKEESRENTRTVDRPQRKEIPDISKEELFSNVPKNFPKPAQTTPDYLGARDVNKKEDTVELSTTEFKYISYFAKLKRQIESVWNYPQESRYRGEQGQLFLIFTIRSNGDLENIELLTSSGYARLDNEALRAIRVAAPFPPFPKDWGALEKLNIKATFIYEFGGFIR